MLATSLSPCACKGIRSCNLCQPNGETKIDDESMSGSIFIYCDGCRQAIRMDIYERQSQCPHEISVVDPEMSIPIEGIFLVSDFLSDEEEKNLIERIDDDVWIPSQSGRWKQDFGIKINFKKQTIKTKYFTGMPWYSHELIERFKKLRLLNDFQSVELCNLDYRPERGSHIDPHIDDVWIWGERLVTINLLSNTILTLFSTNKEKSKTIFVPLPRRWLLVLYGDARYEYKHAIQRQHIHDRRVAVTFRELTSKNEKFYEENKELYEKILRIGQRFTGISVGRFENLTNLYQTKPMTIEQNSISNEIFQSFIDKIDEFPLDSDLIGRARFLARWRLATREQTKNLTNNLIDENLWSQNYFKILEEKKGNYPFLLSNLFTCQDQIKTELEKGLLWSKRRISFYLIDLASILIEDFHLIKQIVESYEQISPLTPEEIDLLDVFVRLELISSADEDRISTDLEICSTNLFFIKSKIR